MLLLGAKVFEVGSQDVSSVAAFASELFVAKRFGIIGKGRCVLCFKSVSFYSKN